MAEHLVSQDGRHLVSTWKTQLCSLWLWCWVWEDCISNFRFELHIYLDTVALTRLKLIVFKLQQYCYEI